MEGGVMWFVVLLVEVCVQACIDGIAEWGDGWVKNDVVSFWWFDAEEAICVVWLATYLASASACHLMEHCQERCGLVVKHVRQRREMRW